MLTISERWAPALLQGGADGDLGSDGIGVGVAYGVGSGVGCWVCFLRRLGGGAPVPFHLQCFCRFSAWPFSEGREPSIWFWRTIVGLLTIASFIFSCSGNSTCRFYSSRTLARGCLIIYCVSSTVACENLPLSNLAIFNARHMSDCSSCIRSPRLGIVADMLKTYKKLVATCNNDIRLVPQPYTLLWPPQRWLKPALSTPVDAYHDIRPQKSQSW